MNEPLFIILMIGLAVFLTIALWPKPTQPWQDSARRGMHVKDCGDCAAGRPCRIRDSWEKKA